MQTPFERKNTQMSVEPLIGRAGDSTPEFETRVSPSKQSVDVALVETDPRVGREQQSRPIAIGRPRFTARVEGVVDQLEDRQQAPEQLAGARRDVVLHPVDQVDLAPGGPPPRTRTGPNPY